MRDPVGGSLEQAHYRHSGGSGIQLTQIVHEPSCSPRMPAGGEALARNPANQARFQRGAARFCRSGV